MERKKETKVLNQVISSQTQDGQIQLNLMAILLTQSIHIDQRRPSYGALHD